MRRVTRQLVLRGSFVSGAGTRVRPANRRLLG
jgi:hypothetical protein